MNFNAKLLAKKLGVSTSQATTLITLLEFPVMNYAMVSELGLFPRGKIQERVLGPLSDKGWIVLHSVPHGGSSSAGRPQKAFSLAEGKDQEIKAALKRVEESRRKKWENARKMGKELHRELGLD